MSHPAAPTFVTLAFRMAAISNSANVLSAFDFGALRKSTGDCNLNIDDRRSILMESRGLASNLWSGLCKDSVINDFDQVLPDIEHSFAGVNSIGGERNDLFLAAQGSIGGGPGTSVFFLTWKRISSLEGSRRKASEKVPGRSTLSTGLVVRAIRSVECEYAP